MVAVLLAPCTGVAAGAVAQEDGSNDFVPPIVAEVTNVVDGDTFEAVWDGSSKTVRLDGVDAPEAGQKQYESAKDLVARLALGKAVQLEVVGRDSSNQILARVRLRDGRELNSVMVRNGMAWWYRPGSDDSALEGLEEKAREERRGLWNETDPLPPWEYRQGLRRDRSRSLITRTTPTEDTVQADDGFWDQYRRQQEERQRQEQERQAQLKQWSVDFYREIQPVDGALTEVRRARKEFDGVGEACRNLRLVLIDIRQDTYLMSPPDTQVKNALQRALMAFSRMATACTEGKDREVEDSFTEGAKAIADFNAALGPYRSSTAER